MLKFRLLIVMGVILSSAYAAEPDPRAALSRPVVLGADDKAAFEEPPVGYQARREGIPHGTLEMVEYDSKSIGTRRRMQVYLPPGYSKTVKYPVLWLLHGIGGDETEWQRFVHVDALMDNLIADEKAVPMIVVMPNGRAQKNDRPEGDIYAAAPAFAAFEKDLFGDVIPTIEARFSTFADREHRALAGLSMGAGQALNFGLPHPEIFAWLGAFSAAPNTKPPTELLGDPAIARLPRKYFLLSCGNKDGLMNVSQGMHAALKQRGIPHTWHVDGNGHDAVHWGGSLYHFARRLFREDAGVTQGERQASQSASTLRGTYEGIFDVGVALSTPMVSGGNAAAADLVARQFSSLTPENDMKWQSLHPRPDQFEFKAADLYIDFAAKHGMHVVGHTLVWHSQTPGWVFQGKDGNPPTREQLLATMREHIHTVVGRYKGRVKGWDVVNEALSDGGPDILRDSPWRRIIGDDFIDYAFRYAREADPGAELHYNDYGLENDRKRANCVALLKGLRARGVPIDAVGTQSHFHIDHPSPAKVEQTIAELAATGLKVMVTELDVDVLPIRGATQNADIARREQGDAASNPYPDKLPDDIQQKLARRYGELFRIYSRHRKEVTRVTLWGLDDGHTWLNNFPIRGRTNYPLLFDRSLKPKPALEAVLSEGSRHP